MKVWLECLVGWQGCQLGCGAGLPHPSSWLNVGQPWCPASTNTFFINLKPWLMIGSNFDKKLWEIKEKIVD